MDYVDYLPRWEPDFAVTEEVLSGRLRIGDLGRDETAWAVADMTARGYSSALISEKLGCTRRHVKRIRARFDVQVMIAFAAERVRRIDAEQRCAEAQRTVARVFRAQGM